jgi:hypothetical protein
MFETLGAHCLAWQESMKRSRVICHKCKFFVQIFDEESAVDCMKEESREKVSWAIAPFEQRPLPAQCFFLVEQLVMNEEAKC